MGIQVQWDAQDPDILVFDLRSQWTWDEFHATVQDLLAMINSAAPPIYIMTLSAAGFPQKVSRLVPPSIALVVVVTDNFLVETVNEIFFRVSPLGRRIGRLAKTIDAARAIIADHRIQRDAAS